MIEQAKPPAIDELVQDEGDTFGKRPKSVKVNDNPPKPKGIAPYIEEPEQKKVSGIREAVEAKDSRPKAYVKDQIERYPESVKPGHIKVVVLDLSSEPDLEKYSQYKTESQDPDLGLTIVYEDVKYDINKNNWKVLLHLLHYQFFPIA